MPGEVDEMPNLYLISSEGYEQSVLTCEGEKLDGMMGESAFKRTILSFGTSLEGKEMRERRKSFAMTK